MSEIISKMIGLEMSLRLNFGVLSTLPGTERKSTIANYLAELKAGDVIGHHAAIEWAPTVLFCTPSNLLQWDMYLERYNFLKKFTIWSDGDLRTTRDGLLAKIGFNNIILISTDHWDAFVRFGKKHKKVWRRIIFDNFTDYNLNFQSVLPMAVFYWFVSFGKCTEMTMYKNLTSCQYVLARFFIRFQPDLIQRIFVDTEHSYSGLVVHKQFSNMVDPKLAVLDVLIDPKTMENYFDCSMETFMSGLGIDFVAATQTCATKRFEYCQDGCSICSVEGYKFVVVSKCCKQFVCCNCFFKIFLEKNTCPYCRKEDFKGSVQFVKDFPAQLVDIGSARDIFDTILPGPKTIFVCPTWKCVDKFKNLAFVDTLTGSRAEMCDMIAKFNDPKYATILAGHERDLAGIEFARVTDMIFIGNWSEFSGIVVSSSETKIHHVV